MLTCPSLWEKQAERGYQQRLAKQISIPQRISGRRRGQGNARSASSGRSKIPHPNEFPPRLRLVVKIHAASSTTHHVRTSSRFQQQPLARHRLSVPAHPICFLAGLESLLRMYKSLFLSALFGTGKSPYQRLEI